MNDTDKARLKELAEKHELNKDHFFKSPQGFVIITRQGIERIQRSLGIRVEYEVVHLSDDNKHVVIKAIGTMAGKGVGSERMETFGESAPENTRQKYPIAMAEKRALARVVLKLSGYYEIGVYSEDESDEFKS